MHKKFNLKSRIYESAVIIVGTVIWSWCLLDVFANSNSSQILQIAFFTAFVNLLGLKSITLPVPGFISIARTEVGVTLSEGVILLMMALYGSAPATLAAGFDGVISSSRVTKRRLSNLFTGAMLTISIFVASKVNQLVLLYFWNITQPGWNHSIDRVGLSLFAANFIHFSVNSLLLSTLLSLRHKCNWVKNWIDNYLWATALFLLTAAATLMYAGFSLLGWASVILGLPVLAVIYISYKQYKDRMEEKVRNLEELKRTQTQLIQAEKLRSLGELSTGVAHDFNNVLTAILGRSQLMRQKLEAGNIDMDEFKNNLDIIIKAAMDGSSTVRRIQNFARVRRDHDYCPVDINSLVKDVMEITRPRWKDDADSRGASINFILNLTDEARVMGDVSELREVLVNMIFNAVDAMPKGGLICISTKLVENQSAPEGKDVQIHIQDTGAGMPPEVISRIFDPFFTTKGERGNGMGLSVSHGIIRRHEGKIEVNSIPGEGTTFIISIPFCQKTAEQYSLESKAATTLKKARILVVDDDPSVRGILVDILRAHDHEVIECDNGAQAIESLRQEQGRFDAIFTDLGMPVMTGWELAREIRLLYPQLLIALITGWGDTIDEEELKDKGVNWVVAKPFQPWQIYKLVEEILSIIGGEQDGGKPQADLFCAQMPVDPNSQQQVKTGRPAALQSEGTDAEPGANDLSASARFLIIDDEEPIRRLLAEIISSQGYEVVEAINGQEGLAAIEEQGEKLTAVFTDISMPEITGWEVAARVKQQYPSLPIVLTSGWGDALDEKDLAHRGIDYLLPKPFEIIRVFELVETLGKNNQFSSNPFQDSQPTDYFDNGRRAISEAIDSVPPPYELIRLMGADLSIDERLRLT